MVGKPGKEQGRSLDQGLSEKATILCNLLEEILRDYQVETGRSLDIPQITLPPQHIVEVCQILKDDPRLRFRLLLCLAAVDYKEYIQLVYLLLSHDRCQTLLLKVDLPYENLTVASITPVWRGANWYEREAHDLFGVDFEGHPDLSPLLLYEGFEDYPGRKEYPFNEYQEF